MLEYAVLSAKLGQIGTALGLLSTALAAMPPQEYPVLPVNLIQAEVSGLEEAIPSTPLEKRPGSEIKPKNQAEVRAIVSFWAKEYENSEYLALFLAEKESQFIPKAKNPISGAKGLFQWLDSSWKSFCTGDAYSPDDNARCAMKTLKEKNGIRHWTADLNMRRWLIRAKFIYCLEGENNCYLTDML